MGKRKRRAHNPPIAPLSPPDGGQCSSGINSSSTEKSSDHLSASIEHPCSSAKEAMGIDEQRNAQFSLSRQHHHHHNPGRPVFVKRSRHRGHHYPRHSLGYHHSTYHGKNNSSLDHQMCFKVGNRWNSDFGLNTEGRERAFTKPERIRSSSTKMEVIPWDDEKMVCGTCERVLQQRRLGSSVVNSEPSVVAVLVCGHVFHADCLQQRTPAEEATDPPCPLCLK